MLKPFGLSVVVSDAALARVTIFQSPIHMVTLSTLAVQISIPAQYHPGLSTGRQLSYQVALKEVNVQQKSSEARCMPKPTTQSQARRQAQRASFQGSDHNGPCPPFFAREFH